MSGRGKALLTVLAVLFFRRVSALFYFLGRERSRVLGAGGDGDFCAG